MKRMLLMAILLGTFAFTFSLPVFAEEAGTPEKATGTAAAALAIASGLGIAIAAFGGALGQGKAVSTALEGIARNPGASDKMFTPLILGLVLIETLVIYALVVAFLLQGKI
ncbi:MAG TPA: ATP synthase F0 subunit C [bacterium]